MIIETFELLKDSDSEELLSIEKLQTLVNDGKFDDILLSHEFLIMTNIGFCLVKKDKSIVVNATVDLSNYLEKQDGYSLVSDNEIIRLSSINNYDDTEIQDKINNCVTKTELESKNYLTEHQSLDAYAKTEDLNNYLSSNALSFDENGNLIVTIGEETKTFAPMTII